MNYNTNMRKAYISHKFVLNEPDLFRKSKGKIVQEIMEFVQEIFTGNHSISGSAQEVSHIYIYIHTYIHTYIYTHTFIHTYILM